MKRLQVIVTTRYEIEVDEDHNIVKEYDSEEEMIEDIVFYEFSPALPVIAYHAVKLLDQQTVDTETTELI